MIVLDDATVRRSLSPGTAIEAVRRALAAHHEGRLVAPTRLHADVGTGALVFTAGRLVGIGYGFRVYDTLPTSDADQLTVVYDDSSGRVRGVVRGRWLGAARTGAIGAVAVDVLADEAAASVGVVGTGTQAWSQLWAIRAVRALSDVRVFGRDSGRRVDFARRCEVELGLPTRPMSSAHDAVADADIVLLATNSETPVIDASWVRPGAHVTTLGPKEVGRHECPIELAARAGVLATDSPAQVDAYPRPNFLAGTPYRSRVKPLAALVGGHTPVRREPGTVTMFLSVGLAGTEVAVAAALLAGAAAGAAMSNTDGGI